MATQEERAVLLLIKGAISELPAEQQAKVRDIADQLRTIIKEGGAEGMCAFALVGGEVNAGEIS